MTTDTASPASVDLADIEAPAPRRRPWAMLALLAALNAADLVTTRAVLAAGGAEANPVMAPIIRHPHAPAAVKVLWLAILAVGIRAAAPSSPIVRIGVPVATALYSFIVAWNLANLSTLAGLA